MAAIRPALAVAPVICALVLGCGGAVAFVDPEEQDAGTPVPRLDAAAPETDASVVPDSSGPADAVVLPDAPDDVAPTPPEAGPPACSMQLDPTFGVGGIATLVNPPNAQPSAIAFEPDGKILVAVGDPSSGKQATVARFDGAGAIDATYGAGGFARVPPPPNGAPLRYAGGLVAQPDGRSLAESYDENTPTLVRINLDGTIDATFGGNGPAYADGYALPTTQWPNWWQAVALLGDGSILVAGSADFNTGGETLLLVQYDRNGELDTTFGTGGSVSTSSMGPGRHVLALPDGSFLVGGDAYAPYFPQTRLQPALEHYTAAGALDIAFGSGGTATTPIAEGGYVVGMVRQSTGAIIVSLAMRSGTGTDDFLLLRYTPDGQLDPTFGEGGMARTDFFGAGDYGTGLSLLPGDALLVAGTVQEPTDASNRVDFGVARYTANGQPDTSFGLGGKLVTSFPQGGVDQADAQGLQADGKLVVAGYGLLPMDGGDDDEILTLARYACR